MQKSSALHCCAEELAKTCGLCIAWTERKGNMPLPQTNPAAKQNQCRLAGVTQPSKDRAISVAPQLDTAKSSAHKLWWVKSSNFQRLQPKMLFELRCCHASAPISRMPLCWDRAMKEGSERSRGYECSEPKREITHAAGLYRLSLHRVLAKRNSGCEAESLILGIF